MASNKLNKGEKQAELIKYRDLVLATIDYYLDNNVMQIKTASYDSSEHFKGLKQQTEEHYQKGRLTRLRQWFHDLTQMQIETGDLKFQEYLRDRTPYKISIFQSYFRRVDKIIQKGKITTDNQFYDVNIMVDQLSQTEPVDIQKIETLNRLLLDYEQRKGRKTVANRNKGTRL